MNRTLRAALLTAALTLTAAPAHAAVLTSGTLTDAAGNPAAGQVHVYAWPSAKRGQAVEMPMLGAATAGPDGQFTVTADDTALQALAGRRGGYLDLTVTGDTGTYSGQWGFTAYIDAPAGAARVATAATAIQARAAAAASPSAAHASAALPVPDVTVRATRRTAFAHASNFGTCDTRRTMKPVGSVRKLTTVGELNNAYNDGTQATFEYSKQGSAETTIGAASQLQDGSWAISAEYTVTDKGQIRFEPFKQRLSRKLKSLFEYTKYEIRNSSCAVPELLVKATSWIGDTDTQTKQDGLDKCDPAQLVGYRSGGRWGRAHGDAVRYTKAVEAFGVQLTARSGFSTNVAMRYVWGGPAGKKHYICGEDGKESAFTSGRVFTGSRK